MNVQKTEMIVYDVEANVSMWHEYNEDRCSILECNFFLFISRSRASVGVAQCHPRAVLCVSKYEVDHCHYN